MVTDFNGFDKGVIGKKLPADSTLNNMKKGELIELLYIAEHNHNVLAQAYKNACDNSKCNRCPLMKDKEIVKFPCKIGDKVILRACCECVLVKKCNLTGDRECPFENDCPFDECENGNERVFETTVNSFYNNGFGWYFTVKGLDIEIPVGDIGVSVYVEQEEIESTLSELED